MIQEYLQRIFERLDSHESILQSELKQMDQEDFELDRERALLTDEVQRMGKTEAVPKMQKLQGLERLIELHKRTHKSLQRSLEELEKVRSELRQLEFRERITMAEIEAESLRQQRQRINEDLIPDSERRMNQLLQQRQEIDSRLLNLNEEISLLRRRSKDVIDQGR